MRDAKQLKVLRDILLEVSGYHLSLTNLDDLDIYIYINLQDLNPLSQFDPCFDFITPQSKEKQKIGEDGDTHRDTMSRRLRSLEIAHIVQRVRD